MASGCSRGSSALLLIAVRGNTNELIPLFAIGVFTGFTLSQFGLVIHWWRTRPPGWRHRAAVNGFGAVITALATAIFLLSKFTQGAWVVVVAVPAFVLLFRRIHAYYRRAGVDLAIGIVPAKPAAKRTLVIVPVTGVSRLTGHAISEALSLGQEVVAVSVVIDQGDDSQQVAQALEREWSVWDPGVPLRILYTEYASVVRPIVAFIDEARADSDQQIVVLIPVVVPNTSATGFSTTRRTGCSRPRCSPVPMWWWLGSPCRFRFYPAMRSRPQPIERSGHPLPEPREGRAWVPAEGQVPARR